MDIPYHPYNFDMADGDIIKFSFSHPYQNKKKTSGTCQGNLCSKS